MKEMTFQAEVAELLRTSGYWAMKWPDSPVSSMKIGVNGRLRFTAPKPCDLIACTGTGRFVAVECKLLRSRTFRVDQRLVTQLETLRTLEEKNAFAVLALNFRFQAKRPVRERVNRAFWLWPVRDIPWKEGEHLALANVETLGIDLSMGMAPRELRRITGGWTWAT